MRGWIQKWQPVDNRKPPPLSEREHQPTLASCVGHCTRGELRMVQEIRSAPVGLRLTPSFKAEIEALAKADSRPLASYIELLLKQHVAAKKAESGKPAGKRK